MPYQDFDEGEVDRVGAFFCFVVMAITIAVVLFLSSCTVGYATSPDGTKTYIGAVGGKGAAKSKQLALNYDNEKSFSDGTIAATAIAGLAYSAATASEQQLTDRTVNSNAAKTTINASNNATKVATGAQHVQETSILHPPVQ